ncbi:MAG: PD40 domain-containing protein [Ignavibacteria bacterium]|nr:PD40 domain-containing protein [Ignavibacteria bacterium]
MNDMYYGGSIQNIISKNISLAFPLWFTEGMAEVQSRYGLDKATDMFMRDATINNYVPPLEYINGYFAYRGGQSFFAWLADTYGEDKIGILMNNVKTFGDVDMGFRETFKISVENLGEKWESYLKKTYWPDLKIREEVKDFSKQLTNHERDGGSYNIAPVISPDGQSFAFISNRDDLFDVYIAKTKTGEIIEKVISGNNDMDFEELHILTPGLSWSPNGRKLAISVKSGASDVIYIIDINSGDKEALPLKFDGIFYVSWSPVGDKIAFVGNRGEKSNLYLYDLRSGKLDPLSDDIFSDANPTWAFDGKSLFFTSDRGDYVEGTKIPKDFKMWEYDYSNTDYYRIDVTTKQITRLSSTEETKEGYGQISGDGKKILYVSDINGINNIYLREADSTGKITNRPITNSLSPIDQISLSRDGKKLLFVSLYKGAYDIFSIDNPLEIDLGMDTLVPTDFVLRMNEYENKFGKETKLTDSVDIVKMDIGRDSVTYTLADSLNNSVPDSINTGNIDPETGAVIDSSPVTLNPETSESVLADSLGNDPDNISDKQKDSLKYYGDDIKISFKDLPKNVSSSRKDSSYFENANFKVADNLNSDGSFKIKNYKIKFTPDLVYGNATYASFYGVQELHRLL